jgi:hypothetical protein
MFLGGGLATGRPSLLRIQAEELGVQLDVRKFSPEAKTRRILNRQLGFP